MNSWYKTSSNDKVLILLRGISGSGKSTLGKQLMGDGQIFSTDDFFMQEDEYKFNPSQLGNAHQWNLDRTIASMGRGESPIIVDNTIIQAWEAKRYVQAAIEHGYKVEVAEPDTPWKFDAEELAKRNTHGVSLKSIQRMINKWETLDPDNPVDQILNSKSPYDRE